MEVEHLDRPKLSKKLQNMNYQTNKISMSAVVEHVGGN
jgi:hypothetical protein